MWTSPNHRAFFGLVGHWLDSIGVVRCALLGLERFKGAHTGTNQAAVIWNIINLYELHHRIGYFTTDNASNNATALQELAKILEKHNIDFSPEQSRVRCFVESKSEGKNECAELSEVHRTEKEKAYI
jgi:hypothetical protein